MDIPSSGEESCRPLTFKLNRQPAVHNRRSPATHAHTPVGRNEANLHHSVVWHIFVVAVVVVAVPVQPTNIYEWSIAARGWQFQQLDKSLRMFLCVFQVMVCHSDGAGVQRLLSPWPCQPHVYKSPMICRVSSTERDGKTSHYDWRSEMWKRGGKKRLSWYGWQLGRWTMQGQGQAGTFRQLAKYNCRQQVLERKVRTWWVGWEGGNPPKPLDFKVLNFFQPIRKLVYSPQPRKKNKSFTWNHLEKVVFENVSNCRHTGLYHLSWLCLFFCIWPACTGKVLWTPRTFPCATSSEYKLGVGGSYFWPFTWLSFTLPHLQK